MIPSRFHRTNWRTQATDRDIFRIYRTPISYHDYSRNVFLEATVETTVHFVRARANGFTRHAFEIKFETMAGLFFRVQSKLKRNSRQRANVRNRYIPEIDVTQRIG